MNRQEAEHHNNTDISGSESKRFTEITEAQRVDRYLQSEIKKSRHPLSEHQQFELLRFSFASYKAEDIKRDFSKPKPPFLAGYTSLGNTIFNPEGELLWASTRYPDAFTPIEVFDFMTHIAYHIYEKRLDKYSQKIARKVVRFVKIIMN